MITKDDYEDLMNESWPSYKIGILEYFAGTVLRAVDPAQFDLEYYAYCHSIEDQEEEEKANETMETALALLYHYTNLNDEFPTAAAKVIARFPSVTEEDLLYHMIVDDQTK